MNPRDDDPPFDDFDNSEDKLVEELRAEMVRLQAEIDQLAAAARERSGEIAELTARMDALEKSISSLMLRARRRSQLWVATAAMYGIALGLALSWLMRF